MTTYTVFVPSLIAPFQFQATLDSAVYTIRIPWNVYGQRYYFQILDQQNVNQGSAPVIPSPLGYDINLAQQFGFTDSFVYRAVTNSFETP